jgi:hypothetical protein
MVPRPVILHLPTTTFGRISSPSCKSSSSYLFLVILAAPAGRLGSVVLVEMTKEEDDEVNEHTSK